MIHSFKKVLFLFLLLFIPSLAVMAQKDTLRVMAYNVLYYGNGCQGPNNNYHNYLKTIITYTHPNVLSLEKMASIPTSSTDKNGAAPYGFADSILQFALNAAYGSRYAYCPFTNNAASNNICMVFYDQHKLGFSALVASYVNGIDINTYKLYYKDPSLAITHDTTFLYITPNHDKSGDEFEDVREMQITGEMNSIKQHFKRLGNHINLGDFNVRNSKEGFYQILTAPEDTGFAFFDPPFYPDGVFKYPADWDHEGKFSAYFTTSTRESAAVPNGCGSGGGGKNWYDHIFISSWIMHNTNYIHYIPHSYRTIGNDGQRFKVSILNKNSHANTSAPAEVLEALYQMSNKYPVMIDLEVTPNTTGNSPEEPVIAGAPVLTKEAVTIAYADKQLLLHFPDALKGQEMTVACMDAKGTSQLNKKLTVTNNDMTLKCKLAAGAYTVTIKGRHNLVGEGSIEVAVLQK